MWTYLTMVFSEILWGADNLVQIGIHQLICNVDITKFLFIRWLYNVLNFNNLQTREKIKTDTKVDQCQKLKPNLINTKPQQPNKPIANKNFTDIFVIHVRKKLNFTQSPFGINSIIKSIRNSLNRHFFLGLGISSSAAHGKTTDKIELNVCTKFDEYNR